MVDKVILDLKQNCENVNTDLIDYELCNGIILKIPTWYCKTQGHFLEEDIILKVYGGLSLIKRNNESLKEAIIDKIIGDFSHLAPIELLEIFKQIQVD